MSRGAPPGARDNGLPASSWWAPLGACDPRLTGELLDRLAAASIPAYAQPHAGERGSYLEVHPPHRPMDRLYVDHGTEAAARALLAGQLGDGEPPAAGPHEDAGAVDTRDAGDLDARFAAIVRGFHEPSAEGAGSGALTSWTGPTRELPRPEPTVLPQPVPPQDDDPFADDDEHYEPPPAEPAPPLHAATKASLAAILAGVALLLAPAFVTFSDTGVSSTLGAVLVAGGTAGLVMRLRDDPDEDDTDDGARV